MARNDRGLAVFSSIAEIKRENARTGGFFFSPETMRVFGSKILPTLYGKRRNVFVTSEDNYNRTARQYSVRAAEYVERSGERAVLDVRTVEEGYGLETRADAVRVAREYARQIDGEE